RAVSCRILVHAEIEIFIEDSAFALFDAGWRAWETNKVVNRVILGVLAYAGTTTVPPPAKLGGGTRNQMSYEDVAVPVQKAQSIWRSVHRENHGIKEANILALFLPLGVPADAFDSTLLADLTSFGTSRGAVAHGSPLRVLGYADPKSEYEQAMALVASLGSIDELVQEGIREVGALHKAITR
ncbi:MAG: hypothetical protein AB7K71_41615, partial [Polyangiaceae bacterium]